MLKFQDEIMGRLSKFELGNLPNSICIVGDSGSGKTTLIEWFVSSLGSLTYAPVKDVTSEMLESVFMLTSPTAYHIAVRNLTEKQQNMLLKILEEPPKLAYFILEADSKFQMLSTVLTRVQVFEMGIYSEAQLREFLTDTTIDISACKTPGDVITLVSGDNNSLPEFTRSIITNVKRASYGSILNIPRRFKDFDSEGKYSFDLFLRLLLKYSATYLSSGASNNFRIFELTQKFVKNCCLPNVNKQRLFEGYLFTLKEVMRDG